MVRLQESKGKFSLIVPKIKIERASWNKEQEFDVELDINGNLVFRPLRR